MDSSDDDFARAKRQGRAGPDSDDSDAGDFLGFGSAQGRSGNDPILGVFGDSSGDEFGGPRRGRKKKAAKGKGKRAKSPEVKPVSFRKGSTLPGQNVKLGETAAKKETEDDLGVPASAQGPQLPTKTLVSEDGLSKTYGKGLNLLKKMGWQGGGLGSNQEGIANPIQVFQRKDRQGLQEEDEMQDQDLYGREEGRRGKRRSVEEILGTPVADPGNKGRAGGSFSSSLAPQSKRRKGGRTAEELAAELRKKLMEDQPVGMVIKDMRGPTVKVVNSVSGLLGEDEFSGKCDGPQGEMDLEGKVMMIVEKRKYYEDMLINVTIDIASLNAASSVSEEEGKQCRLMVAALEHLRELQDEGTITSQGLAAEIEKLRKQQPKAFKELSAFDVAIALAAPLSQKELKEWDPMLDAAMGLSSFAVWRKLIEDKDSKEKVSNLMEAVLLPRLRASISAWPVHDAEPCIGLMRACKAALPQEASDALIEQVVLPRLQAAIEAWDPRVDKLPAHLWIHPWLPMLGDKLKVLWMPIRLKLAQQLADPQAKQLLQVWQQVLDPSNWEPLVAKLLSRLHDAIVVVPVRPDGQNLSPFKDLFNWLGLLPNGGIASVLERGLFPQWQEVLRNWLQQPTCDFTEVLKWYKGWRSFLPSEMLGQVTIRRQLAHGLQVMRSMMPSGAKADMQGTEHEPPLDEPSEHEREGAPAPPQPPPAVEEVSLSVADYLAEIAGDQGLMFRPKNGSSELGKQVYLFGAAQVYVEKGAVYAQGKAGKGSWRPVVHSELLFLAKGSGR
mmetsp:Transcript_6395/g.15459  ORF Transcript_6395/g.15459 Transcript_6395/m.15459 type:complete len:780 (-) Transcript_6395:30-2369(-)